MQRSSDIVEDLWLNDDRDTSGDCDLSSINPQPLSPLSSVDNDAYYNNSSLEMTSLDTPSYCKHESEDLSKYKPFVNSTSGTCSADSGFLNDSAINSSSSQLDCTRGYSEYKQPLLDNRLMLPSTYTQPIMPINIFVSSPPSHIHSTTLPQYSVSCAQQFGFVNHVTTPTRQLAPSISLESTTLYQYIRNLTLSMPHHAIAISRIEAGYQFETASIETLRYNSLLPGTQLIVNVVAINASYDDKQRDLIRQTYSKLVELSSAHTAPKPLPSQNVPRSEFRPLTTSTPSQKRNISQLAVRVMNEWYNMNAEHPYPTYGCAAILGQAGGITVEQVKKWFANKRMRCNNTKHLSVIAARRVGNKRRKQNKAAKSKITTDVKSEL